MPFGGIVQDVIVDAVVFGRVADDVVVEARLPGKIRLGWAGEACDGTLVLVDDHADAAGFPFGMVAGIGGRSGRGILGGLGGGVDAAAQDARPGRLYGSRF